MYDLRHHAITALLENPHVSEETVEAIAGHISREMKKRYSHVRMDARRKAVSQLDGSTADLSSDTVPFRNQDVLNMLSGLSPRIVAEQIKHSLGNFDTSPEALKKLQSEGVPEVVIHGHVPCEKEETRLKWNVLRWCRAGKAIQPVGNCRHEKTRIDRRRLAWTKGRNGSRQSSLRQVL